MAEAKKVQSDEKADKEAYENATKSLNEKIMPIGAKMYEQEQAEAAKANDSENSSEASETKSEEKTSSKKSKKEEPVEGEVVDEDKKS